MKKEPLCQVQETFDLETFLPFILNQTAEVTGQSFQRVYRRAYGMTRTQWRVLAIVGRYGRLTAREVCDIAHEEKSGVSRAVSALESEGYLKRQSSPEDRRAEHLSLTEKGWEVFSALGQSANAFNAKLKEALGPDGEAKLLQLLDLLQRVATDMEVSGD